MKNRNAAKPNRLKVRAEFLRAAASGVRFVAPGFILQKAKTEIDKVRYGLTATKKLGNAVTRNRARRRLRALAEGTLLIKAMPGEYVLIAREAALERNFAQMQSDLEKALKVLKCHK